MVALYRMDLAILGQEGSVVVAVEIKNAAHLDPDRAVEIYRYLIGDTPPPAPYFLLLSQDWGYVWQQASPAEAATKPACRFSMAGVVERYFKSLTVDDRLRENELTLIVFDWLSSLTDSPREPAGEAEEALAAAGVLDAIRDGRVMREVQVTRANG